MISPLRTRGMRARNCSLSAGFVQNTEGPQPGPTTHAAQTTLSLIEAHLVFFSTFEELKLPARGPMDHATTKLYEPSPTPILFVASCHLILGRVPLFPCFLNGNATPTIPHKLRNLKASAFQHGSADAAAADGRRGSNVYEVNPWLWQFGRGRPRLGGLSVTETEERRETVLKDGAKRSHETSRRREAAKHGDE